jgi:hypothetical protein
MLLSEKALSAQFPSFHHPPQQSFPCNRRSA